MVARSNRAYPLFWRAFLWCRLLTILVLPTQASSYGLIFPSRAAAFGT